MPDLQHNNEVRRVMRKVLLIILVCSVFFFLVTIGIFISMFQIDKQTEDITIEYSATVRRIHINNSVKNKWVQIETEEYDSSLYISVNISKNINMNKIIALKEGEKIFFRIENIKVKQMNFVDFVDIVSLKTETDDIFTLNDYNYFMRISARPARIANIIVALILLVVSVLCFVLIKHRQNLS